MRWKPLCFPSVLGSPHLPIVMLPFCLREINRDFVRAEVTIAETFCPICINRDQDSMEKGRNDPKKGKDCSELGEKCIHQQLVAERKMRR